MRRVLFFVSNHGKCRTSGGLGTGAQALVVKWTSSGKEDTFTRYAPGAGRAPICEGNGSQQGKTKRRYYSMAI
jgi:hypothetical protein